MPSLPPSWDQYAVAWSRLHGDFDPRSAPPLIRGWVYAAYRTASVLARARIGPTTVTLAGLLLCGSVPLIATTSLIAAALIVLAAALADTLDGAVAVVSGRTTRLGYVIDSVADRVGEAAWLLAFWLAGAPAGWVVAAGAASWLHEYARARAGNAGMSEIGAVTVAERPTRVSLAISGLLIAGVFGHVTPILTAAAVAWVLLTLIGSVQLAAAIGKALN